ncbi:hypothetical protein AB0L68_30805 [Streptomyces sp. NPDC052164]|uniref:hypothetical protein n=1 Tax=Streptomyces sp. NPDC052164 TaxID=3155529 RepID=UPI00342EFDB5
MTGKELPQLVFVHGIGGLRDTAAEEQEWLRALATGARAAGRPDLLASLTSRRMPESWFVNYSDLFVRPGAQGGPGAVLDDGDAPFLAELLGVLLDDLEAHFPEEEALLEGARSRVDRVAAPGAGVAQGPGRAVRTLLDAASQVLRLPVLRQSAQWLSARSFLADLAQVGRYLDRGKGADLGETVRQRVLDGLDPERPLVVVAHSLGTVVTYETLHEYDGEVALWVTLGSPLTLGGMVRDRLVPRPARCPDGVREWRNFWDRDDIVVGRPRREGWAAGNAAGVQAVTERVVCGGLWTHTAAKYLAQPTVAGPVVKALGS